MGVSPTLAMGSTLLNCIPRHRAGQDNFIREGAFPPHPRAALHAHPHVGSQLRHPKGLTCWGWSCRNQVMGKLGVVLKPVRDRDLLAALI